METAAPETVADDVPEDYKHYYDQLKSAQGPYWDALRAAPGTALEETETEVGKRSRIYLGRPARRQIEKVIFFFTSLH
jgi:hypothetical protein